ncbi:hypothetical protein W02_06960 [Nitrospira sp. KM1]|uniref:class I SAM-dependent methyltransferase n=1 Tax=Nitrospira sp. KM1 TaxID=1936990 RepID=UPI0013A7977F|nr:class I SAM-dependent methyltransferase [Nitrospira sp. KM1]BCA53556.1 hypothetical protein W02_06960 [Nitrospira sp. KM1]
MINSRKGYDERVNAGRAIPLAPERDLDDDPAMMVQEQIARIKFLDEKSSIRDRKVLDLGCGTGFNFAYAKEKLGSKEVTGVDISSSAIAYAKKIYPAGSFLQGDICSQNFDCGNGIWDTVICCEVIEHVDQPQALLDTIHRHLRHSGVGFVSTPNRPVFSLGFEPSPVNHTHVKEFTLDEFRSMLEEKFSKVEIWGQRFTNDRLFKMQQSIVARNIKDYRLLGEWYWQDSVRRIWKTLRCEPLQRLWGGGLKYSHGDFAFANPVTQDSIWLCAFVVK